MIKKILKSEISEEWKIGHFELDLAVTLVGFAGQIELDLPVILSGISRSFSVGLSIM